MSCAKQRLARHQQQLCEHAENRLALVVSRNPTVIKAPHRFRYDIKAVQRIVEAYGWVRDETFPDVGRFLHPDAPGVIAVFWLAERGDTGMGWKHILQLIDEIGLHSIHAMRASSAEYAFLQGFRFSARIRFSNACIIRQYFEPAIWRAAHIPKMAQQPLQWVVRNYGGPRFASEHSSFEAAANCAQKLLKGP